MTTRPTTSAFSDLFPATFLLAALFVLLSVSAFKNPDILPAIPYTYDEADYRHAANQGFLSNYLDRGGLPLGVFIEKGFKAGLNKEEWGRLSSFVRSSNETAFFRHYHGPLYFYWLIAMKQLGATTEQQMRYATLVLLFFCALLMYFILLRLFPQESRVTIFSLAFLVLAGPSAILTFNHLTPHGLFACFSTAALGCATLFGKTGNRRFWYVALVAASLAFLTLEYAALLLPALLITVWHLRKTLFTPLTPAEKKRFLAVSALCFVLPVLILWPGGVLKLTVVKNYLFYAYFTFIRGEYYGNLPIVKVWAIRIVESPVEYAVLFAGIVTSVLLIRKNRWLLPLMIYGFCVLLTGLRNASTFPQYLSSVFPPFYLCAAAGLFALPGKATARVRSLLAVILVVAVAANTALFFTLHAPWSLQRMPYQISSMDDFAALLTDNRIPFFISREYIPTIQYYFPGSSPVSFNPAVENDSAVIERVVQLMKKEQTPALLFLDREQPSTRQWIDARTVLEQRRELTISDRIPNAVCYRLSFRGTDP